MENIKFWIAADSTIYILTCKCGARFNPYQYKAGELWECPACERRFEKTTSYKELVDEDYNNQNNVD